MLAEDVLEIRGKRIFVVGDAMKDVYVLGKQQQSQDGCVKFVERERVSCPGGAANAAKSLRYSGSFGFMFCGGSPSHRKIRFVEDGRVVFRHDIEPEMEWKAARSSRELLIEHLDKKNAPDAVYIADYAKGFLSDEFIGEIVSLCAEAGIPCVADLKRDPKLCRRGILKCNQEFALRWTPWDQTKVVTASKDPPTVQATGEEPEDIDWPFSPPPCVNHVGAGDCFGAWMTLGLAHGLPLKEAARLGHAAGRVYVRHPFNRAPWPHEIRRELEPLWGKRLFHPADLDRLRKSVQGRIVFTNGVFRVPHAGHAWAMEWARRQGDVLVLGVNDDISAFRVKEGQFCLPLEQRLGVLMAQQCVDYVYVFGDNDPTSVVRALRPDVIVKGHDRAGEVVPGSEFCEVRFAPPSPFPHVSDMVRSIRG